MKWKFNAILEYLLHPQIQELLNKVLENRINLFIIRIIIHEQNIFLGVQIILFQMRNMLRNKP